MSKVLKISLAFTVAFGLWIGIFTGFDEGVAHGLNWGLITAGITFVSSLIAIPIFAKIRNLDLRSDPKASATINLDVPPEVALKQAVRAVAAAGGQVSVRDRQAGLVLAAMPASGKSWGERIRVEVRSAAGGSSVSVQSRPKMGLTIADWGKGKENVDSILGALRPEADANAPAHEPD